MKEMTAPRRARAAVPRPQKPFHPEDPAHA